MDSKILQLGYLRSKMNIQTLRHYSSHIFLLLNAHIYYKILIAHALYITGTVPDNRIKNT